MKFPLCRRMRLSTLEGRICSVLTLFLCLLIWSPIAAATAAPTCVVKLKLSSDNGSDDGTSTFVKSVLTTLGYKIINDGLFTLWSSSDYDVKITVTHTDVPNYGFPVSLMTTQFFIEDSSGKVLVDGYIDRANVEATLQSWFPACGTTPASAPLPAANADAAAK